MIIHKKYLTAATIFILSMFTLFGCDNNSEGPSQKPAITSINPKSGPPGTKVTIKGQNFTDNSIVMFGDSTADIMDQTESKIDASVPQGLAQGKKYNVTVSNQNGKVTGSSPDQFKVTQPGSISGCNVTLYDGDNYKDDHITVDGPGEFSNLKNLPDAEKDWSKEADSFKAGDNAVVIFWSKTDFEGDSTKYDAGAEKASIDNEPASMKIKC
jgi:hypothetical protein